MKEVVVAVAAVLIGEEPVAVLTAGDGVAEGIVKHHHADAEVGGSNGVDACRIGSRREPGRADTVQTRRRCR